MRIALMAPSSQEALRWSSALPRAAGVDPSTFLVGHPASPRWQVRHANADHPAIAMRREATRRSIDPNTFIVQPPAHVQWTHREEVAVAYLGAN